MVHQDAGLKFLPCPEILGKSLQFSALFLLQSFSFTIEVINSLGKESPYPLHVSQLRALISDGTCIFHSNKKDVKDD